MGADPQVPSARREELLELAYAYVLRNGIAGMSLRPLAEAVGSSPRVLLYLFGSKDGLVRALLGRSRTEELALLAEVRAAGGGPAEVVERLWEWLVGAARGGPGGRRGGAGAGAGAGGPGGAGRGARGARARGRGVLGPRPLRRAVEVVAQRGRGAEAPLPGDRDVWEPGCYQVPPPPSSGPRWRTEPPWPRR
jgi:AcrR family transcriptional regulator